MIKTEVKLPASIDLKPVEGLVQETCRARGLNITVKTSLVSYPGSVHWHFRKGAARGTLEVTFWESGRRLWISVHSNRAGSWTTGELRDLKSDLERGLNSQRWTSKR
jgi:hypothetical protein